MANTRYLIFTDDSSNPKVVLKSNSKGKFNDLPTNKLRNSGKPLNTLSL